MLLAIFSTSCKKNIDDVHADQAEIEQLQMEFPGPTMVFRTSYMGCTCTATMTWTPGINAVTILPSQAYLQFTGTIQITYQFDVAMGGGTISSPKTCNISGSISASSLPYYIP